MPGVGKSTAIAEVPALFSGASVIKFEKATGIVLMVCELFYRRRF